MILVLMVVLMMPHQGLLDLQVEAFLLEEGISSEVLQGKTAQKKQKG